MFLTFRFMPIINTLERMSTYPFVRPIAISQLKEGHINYETQRIRIRPKARKGKRSPKWSRILSEDIELLKRYRSIGAVEDLPYFRHPDGSPFGNKFLSRIWNNEVEKLCEEGLLEKKLTMYEGTKPTTISESEYDTYTTQDASGHQSRKAHAHYDHKLEKKRLEVYRSFSPVLDLEAPPAEQKSDQELIKYSPGSRKAKPKKKKRQISYLRSGSARQNGGGSRIRTCGPQK